LDETYERAFERVKNPPKMNVVVPIVMPVPKVKEDEVGEINNIIDGEQSDAVKDDNKMYVTSSAFNIENATYYELRTGGKTNYDYRFPVSQILSGEANEIDLEIVKEFRYVYSSTRSSGKTAVYWRSDSDAMIAGTYIPGTITFNKAIKKAVTLTHAFEGSSFSTVIGNFDGAGISVGILGWNIGQGSLQPLLLKMNKTYPAVMKRAFGDKYGEITSVLTKSNIDQLAWAISINDSNNNIIPTWNSKFKALGNTTEFQNIQLQEESNIINSARKIFNDFGLSTERGLALAFDIAVQNGSVIAGTSIVNNVSSRTKNSIHRITKDYAVILTFKT